MLSEQEKLYLLARIEALEAIAAVTLGLELVNKREADIKYIHEATVNHVRSSSAPNDPFKEADRFLVREAIVERIDAIFAAARR